MCIRDRVKAAEERAEQERQEREAAEERAKQEIAELQEKIRRLESAKDVYKRQVLM